MIARAVSVRRPAFALFLLLMLAVLAPSMPAQQDSALPPRERESERLERNRGRVFSRDDGRGLTPEDAAAAEQLLQEGIALEERGELRAALGKYKRIYKKYPRSLAAPEAYYRTGNIQYAQGRVEKAFEAYDAIVRAYPDFGHFNELISKEYTIAYDLVKGRVKRKVLGLIDFGANRERGIMFFERLVFNAPYSDYAPLALMNIAETYLDMDNFDSAIFTLDRLISNYPNSIVTPDAYLRMAQVQERLVDGPEYDMGATQESINHYEDFLILYGDDPNVAQAEEGLARMKQMMAESRIKMADFYYYKRDRYQAARVFYNEAITIAPTSEAAESARQKLAQLEVDEARELARRAERAGRPERNGFFGLFKRAKTVEPIVLPDDPEVRAEEEAKRRGETVTPGTVEREP